MYDILDNKTSADGHWTDLQNLV